MIDLTPLAAIPAFDENMRKRLSDFWITSAQEFVTIARSSNRQHGSGAAALAQALGVPRAQIDALVRAADLALPPDFAFALPEEPLVVGTGAIFEGMEVVEPPPSFDVTPVRLPPAVRLARDLPPPQNQGQRNTCVAFTLVALYQQASGDSGDLSEQFLYWACKANDGIPGDVGTRPDVAMRMLAELGVCPEATWPYSSAINAANPGQGPPPPGAHDEARQRRITGFTVLGAKDVHAIKQSLADGKGVLLGLPINEHWTSVWPSLKLGRVRRPLPGEAVIGGHAMAALGYQDDDSTPGGGYFIVRNSWGTTWAPENPDGPGYAHVPFRLVADSNLAAFVIDGVVKAPPPPAPLPEQAPALPPAAQSPSLEALYAEAQAIKRRLDALIKQLDALMGAGEKPPAPRPKRRTRHKS